MPAELVWRPQALEDLRDIYVTIGIDNEEAAERVYSALEVCAGMLPDFPRMGPRRPEITLTARILVEGSYLVLYELNPDTEDGPVDSVEVVRTIHGHRDLTRLF